MAKILAKKTPASKSSILVKNKELEKVKEKEKQEQLERKKQVTTPVMVNRCIHPSEPFNCHCEGVLRSQSALRGRSFSNSDFLCCA